MKFVILFLVSAACTGFGSGFIITDLFFEIGKAVLDEKFRMFLEDLKPMLKAGNNSLRLPVIDPLHIMYRDFNITEEMISIEGDFTDMIVHGLSDYDVKHAKFEISALEVAANITWFNINATSLYQFHCEIAEAKELPIYGDGDLRVDVTNFTFAAKAKLGLNAKNVYIKDLSTGMSLGTIKFDASGIYGNDAASETVNTVLTSSMPFIVEHYQWVIRHHMDMRLKDMINSQLEDVTLQDMLNLIEY